MLLRLLDADGAEVWRGSEAELLEANESITADDLREGLMRGRGCYLIGGGASPAMVVERLSTSCPVSIAVEVREDKGMYLHEEVATGRADDGTEVRVISVLQNRTSVVIFDDCEVVFSLKAIVGAAFAARAARKAPAQGDPLEQLQALFDRLDQDDPANESPLSGADFVDAVGALLKAHRDE